ncbi:MAG: PEP-CTERM system TPR-repeat protein PrsT, partial [Rubrivivax sp.]|nr:PEP-CTERM system TPR-repeat protein PrsT [Rubrivivax sp.]
MSDPKPVALRAFGPRPSSVAVRRRIHVAAVLACCSAALALGGCGKEAPAPSAPVTKAPAGDPEFNARVIGFKNQLQQDPYLASARFGLGLLLLEYGDPHAAEIELSKAVELGMDPNVALPVLARTWNVLGMSKKLIEAHGNTQLTDPTASAELKAALATAYANTGDPEKARALAAAALQDDPQSTHALVLQAKIALSDGRVDDALQSIATTSASHPRAVDAWELKGDVLLMVRNDVEGATAAYEQALVVEPRNLPIHAKLIAMAIGAKDLSTAQTRLGKLNAIAPGSLPQTYLTARLAYARGDLKAAQETIKVALTEHPKDLRSLLLSAEIDLAAGSLRTAEDALGNALTVGSTVARVRHLLAQTYLRLGAPEKAQAILEPLVRTKSDDATALGLAAEAALQSGLTFVATRLYQRAAEADPTNARYRTSLAMARIATGDVDAGLADLASSARADPTAYGDMALFAARLRVGDLSGATVAAESAAQKQPASPVPQWALGRLKLLGKRNPAEARTHFERALAADAAFVPAAVALASLDLDTGDAGMARRRLEGALALNPENLDALLALADIRRKAGDSDQTVTAALEAVVRSHPKEPRARLALINHMLRAGDASAALLAAQNAAAQLPDDLSVTDALGRAQMESGESAQALVTFGKIASARPRSPEPHLRMADVFLARNELASAMDSLNRAVAIDPGLMVAHVKLVEVATSMQDWPGALKLARTVQRKFPDEPKGFHLEGLVYAAQQKWDPALVAFQKAMAIRASSELMVQVHTTLRAAGKADEADRQARQWLAKHPADQYF